MKERYSQAAKYILLAIGLTGFVVVAAAAPGILQIARLVDHRRLDGSRKHMRRNTVQTVRRLQESDMFVIKEKRGKFVVELTEKGRQKFREMEFAKLQIPKPPRWDRKWRVVIFDIPDRSFKYGRDALRSQLKKWKFYQLQKSVWVCPWPCEKEMRAVTEWHEISSYVNIITAEKILDDLPVRKHFGMS